MVTNNATIYLLLVRAAMTMAYALVRSRPCHCVAAVLRTYVWSPHARYYHVHISKTGGTTFERVLVRLATSAGLKMVSERWNSIRFSC